MAPEKPGCRIPPLEIELFSGGNRCSNWRLANDRDRSSNLSHNRHRVLAAGVLPCHARCAGVPAGWHRHLSYCGYSDYSVVAPLVCRHDYVRALAAGSRLACTGSIGCRAAENRCELRQGVVVRSLLTYPF